MTLDEFFNELAKGRGKFVVDETKGLRAIIDDYEYCPITWVAKQRGRDFDIDEVSHAALYLGDEIFDGCAALVDAADYVRFDMRLEPYRHRLLQTLGLEELH